MSTPAGWYPDPTAATRTGGSTATTGPIRSPTARPSARTRCTVAVPGRRAPAGSRRHPGRSRERPPQPGPPPGAPGNAPGWRRRSGTPVAGARRRRVPRSAPTPVPPARPRAAAARPGSSSPRSSWCSSSSVAWSWPSLGGDDGGDDRQLVGHDRAPDQSDEPEEEDDPSASDLFDDMADRATTRATTTSSAPTTSRTKSPTTRRSPDGGVPPRGHRQLHRLVHRRGEPGVVLRLRHRPAPGDVPYDRFIEIDQQLAENPDDIPSELTDAAAACQ